MSDRTVRQIRRLRTTGALASKQIFPALHGLIRHDGLDRPVIMVARSGDRDTLRERARRSIEASGGAEPKGSPGCSSGSATSIAPPAPAPAQLPLSN